MLMAIKALVSATVAILAGSSATNMIQTAVMVKEASRVKELKSTEMMQPFFSPDAATLAPDEAVQHLNTMSRKQLLQVFLASPSPTGVSEMVGEWDGQLLDNNGVLMTAVSSIMTHRLFGGKDHLWNGKVLPGTGAEGTNRFVVGDDDGRDQKVDDILLKHDFDVGIETSGLQKSGQSVVLRYHKHQTGLSLWKTMFDEIRVLPNTDGQVLIGMGCLQATGGIWNAAPFCLYGTPKV